MTEAKDGHFAPAQEPPMESRIAYMLNINGRRRIVEAEGSSPLLWVMCDEPGLSCMPFSCSGGFCGACTIEVDGVSVRACTFPVEEAVGRKIVSPGGRTSDRNHPLFGA